MNKSRITLWTDVSILLAFLCAAGLGLSYLSSLIPDLPVNPWRSIHLLSGMVLFCGIVMHLALHARWIRTTAKQLVKKASWMSRVNFGLDCLLCGVFILICLSGLNRWFSSAGYPTLFHVRLPLWEAMHRGTGTALMIYVILHLALHWRYIVNVIKKNARWHREPKQPRAALESE